MTDTPPRPLPALQETLAAEHAAVHVYSVLGGLASALSDPEPGPLLEAAYEVHRARRDQLRSLVADLGRTPVPAAPGYEVDVEEPSREALLRVARTTEERCAAVYAQLVASSVAGHRRWAVTALTDAAVRLLGLGAAPSAYPGAPELQPDTIS